MCVHPALPCQLGCAAMAMVCVATATQAAEPGPCSAHPALAVPRLQAAAEVTPIRPETSPQAGARFTF